MPYADILAEEKNAPEPDEELAAVARCVEVLEELGDLAAVGRIVRYLTARYS